MNAFYNFTSGLANCIVAQNIQFSRASFTAPCAVFLIIVLRYMPCCGHDVVALVMTTLSSRHHKHFLKTTSSKSVTIEDLKTDPEIN